MSLPLSHQADLAIQSIVQGDVDLFSKVLTDPAAVSIDEQRTLAEKLGVKNNLLKAFVNVCGDPVVWLSFMFSKRFPTLSWLRGDVPQRFIGAANEFTGVSQYTRPVEMYFRGTPVPRMVALAKMRELEVMKVGQDLFKLMDRPNWSTEMPIVSQLLDGQTPAGATYEHKALADKMRVHVEDLWGFLGKTKMIVGGMEGTEVTRAKATHFPGSTAPRYLRDYLPHIPLLGDASTIEVDPKAALSKFGMDKVRQALEAVGENPADVWRPSAGNSLASDFTRYQAFLNNVQGQVWSPHIFSRQRLNIPLQSHLGQELFVTDLNVVFQKYVHAVARTYALNAPISNLERSMLSVRQLRDDGSINVVTPNSDPLIVQIINHGIDAAGFRTVTRPVLGTQHAVEALDPRSGNPLAMRALQHLVKSVRGQLDEGEINFGNLFSSIANKIDRTVRLTTKQAAEIDWAMQTQLRNKQWRSVSNGITSFFYGSTLGLNAWSTAQNLLQPVLTTAPAMGIGPTLAGIKEMGGRIPQYFSQFRKEWSVFKNRGTMRAVNEAAESAFTKVFPELAQSGIKLDARAFSMGDVDPDSPWSPGTQKVFKTYDEFTRFMLQPFTNAEMSNQATTFFTARRAITDAMRRGEYEVPSGLDGRPLVGADLDKWVNFESNNIVNLTQFRPTPGSRTIWQGSVPGFVRQFTSFPVRMLSFMGESTVRGAMAQGQLENADLLARATGGRNLGTLARMVMYGRIAQVGARDVLGIDLSNALGVTSAFNLTPQGQPFAPLPIPPVASTAAGLISAATTRDIKEMQPMTLPGIEMPWPRALFPAGLQVSRVIRAMRQWQPDTGEFVDDSDRVMYKGNTTDVLLSMLGVPLEKNRRVRDAMERIQDVRQKVRDIRRNYAIAVAGYDTGAMSALENEWSQKFPDWPPLSVERRDVKRYNAATRMPMVSRMLRTMGEAGRYLEREMYEFEPDLVATPADQAGPLVPGISQWQNSF